MNFNKYITKHNTSMKNSASKDLVKRLEDIIGSGGDRRLKKTNKHMNKYFISPISYEKVLNRGSCTCSPFTPKLFSAHMTY